MADIQLYRKGITVESVRGDVLFARTSEVSVMLNDVSASDFVNEFTAEEILEAMDFSRVYDWAMEMKGDDEYEDFSGATEGDR